MDPVALRKQYGEELLLIGGIDKRVLARENDAIEEELMKKLPYLFSMGGYIAWTDHLIPPDVPFENYMYYLERMKEISLNPRKYL
jgi:uroporphyrinogen decarboxylase